MVKAVTERHGGRILCESELGKGSTFSLQLPLLDD
jgi:signal transduction histidine kinase